MNTQTTLELPAIPPLPPATGSARAWQCNLGNGEWDHDWQEKHDDSGEVDGIPGDHWSWRECRVCGEIEAPNDELKNAGPRTLDVRES